MNRNSLVILFLGISFSFTSLGFSYEDIVRNGSSILCQIGKVDDGDTFDLHCGEKFYPNVRLLGVNTPDKNQDEIGYKHCYYNEAKQYIEKQKSKVFQATFYGSDLCKDPYKGCRNLVRLVDHTSGSDLGRTMIMRGLAFSWVKFSMIPLEIKEAYKKTEEFSKEENTGLWKACNIAFHPNSQNDSPVQEEMTE